MAQTPKYDIRLTVGEDGVAISGTYAAAKIDGFAVKAPNGATWSWDVSDQDGFQVASSLGSTGPVMGSAYVPVQKQVLGFFFALRGATPGDYEIRFYAD